MTIIFCNLLLALLFGTFCAHAAEISYVYDEMGRLRAVIDPNSDAAVYNYDAVGNLLSISRQTSSVVSIIDFSPKTGPVGTSITIYGTGFSTTPTQNTVTFNGVAATVTSSSATKLVTTVPIGATTGSIAVTGPGGSATSAEVFTVGPTSAPTITGFTPTIGTPGTAVTITGTNFNPTPTRNDIRFNLSRVSVGTATATTLSTTVPSATASGRISVTTAYGRGVSNGDFFIPPAPYGPADVQYTGRMSVAGASQTVTISTATKIGLVLFDGVAGQKIDLGVNSSTFPCCSNWLGILKPDGTTLVSNGSFGTGTNLDATLPVTGTYTIWIDPSGTNTGSITLTLSEELNFGTIVINGDSATATTSRVGQRGGMTFAGTASQQITVRLTSNSMGSVTVSLLKPDGSQLTSSTSSASSFNLTTQTLPTTGTYTILVDPAGTNTGSMNVAVTSP